MLRIGSPTPSGQHTSNIKQTEQILVTYLGIYMLHTQNIYVNIHHTHTHLSTTIEEKEDSGPTFEYGGGRDYREEKEDDVIIF